MPSRFFLKRKTFRGKIDLLCTSVAIVRTALLRVKLALRRTLYLYDVHVHMPYVDIFTLCNCAFFCIPFNQYAAVAAAKNVQDGHSSTLSSPAAVAAIAAAAGPWSIHIGRCFLCLLPPPFRSKSFCHHCQHHVDGFVSWVIASRASVECRMLRLNVTKMWSPLWKLINSFALLEFCAMCVNAEWSVKWFNQS